MFALNTHPRSSTQGRKATASITRSMISKNFVERLQKLVEQDSSPIATTSTLLDALGRCSRELEALELRLRANIQSSIRHKAMKSFGLRALKWPLTSTEVEQTIQHLENYGNTFSLALQVDQAVLVADISQKVDLPKLPVATGGCFDSHAEEHNATCLPNTRTDILRTITAWAINEDSKPIFWLCGMAGTGKSTIARTAARNLAEAGQLGASFFFKKGGGERGNASRFFTTIAVDPIPRQAGILPGIRKALSEDPALSQRALRDQFEKLILHPLSQMRQGHSTMHAIVVIDALDECEREEDIRTILELLTRTKDLRPISLRALVTSRPELHIRLGFKQMPNGSYQDLGLHNVAKSTIEHDIRLFYESKLTSIRKARMLSPDWPTADQIQALVDLAVPLFIFAATMCRYIGTKGGYLEDYLNKALSFRKSTFSQLNKMYLPILEQLLVEQEGDMKEAWLQAFRKIVGSIVVLESPLSIASLARLLQVPQKEIECRLDDLHSVLSIPDNGDAPVRVLHLSFREFLVAESNQRSAFWVNERAIHKELASHCLELMSGPDGLRQNICDLHPGDLRSEVDETKIKDHLSPELQYACRYWVHHLKHSKRQISDVDTASTFLQEHFLRWLEAMSLGGDTNRCAHMLNSLSTLVNPADSTLSVFLQDARRFTLRFQSILQEAPLQIYSSALIFAPEASIVRKVFVDKIPGWIKSLSGKEDDWDACRSVLEGHTCRIFAVAFSPNGQLVASTSDDTTVRVWDVTTGSCRSLLEGHTGAIRAVVFSPDGQLVASTSSCDSTVRVWEMTTGTCQRVLEGHTGGISAVVFSPDGKILVSAGDSTIRVWEVTTGSCRSVLECHTGDIKAVAFSPDGQLVACAGDSTIQIWDVRTGSCRNVLKGPTTVTSIAFSPDGEYIQTNLGTIPLRSPITVLPLSRKLEPPYLSVRNEWIFLDRQRLFWLPSGYRPSCVAVHDYLVGIGHYSGRISLLEFCIA